MQGFSSPVRIRKSRERKIASSTFRAGENDNEADWKAIRHGSDSTKAAARSILAEAVLECAGRSRPTAAVVHSLLHETDSPVVNRFNLPGSQLNLDLDPIMRLSSVFCLDNFMGVTVGRF